jgi:hypothetical protein
MIKGKQCTILWYIDDLKISHIDKDVVTKILEIIDEHYGKVIPFVLTRGKVHDYLGMTLDFSTSECCIVRMDDYVESVLEEAPSDMDGEAETPAAEHLFTVQDNAPKVTKDVGDLYHSLTARLLFLSKWARPEIQTAVVFLCTRTQATDADDYNKLARVVHYLRWYPKLALTLEADDIWVVKWLIDASFAVHADMQSHTSGCGSLGKGMFSTTSSKQKMNTHSSTEAELVGVNDMMAKVLWMQYFLKEQVYDVGPAVVAQDNKSLILLETNGMKSSTKRTRHINVQYYFVTDRIDKGDMVVEYCPTADMISDVLIKPLQGSAFHKLRANLKNDPTTTAVVLAHRSVLEPITTGKRGCVETWHDDVMV